MKIRELIQLLELFENDDVVVIGNTFYDDNGNATDVEYCEPLNPEYWDENKGIVVLYPGKLISG